MTDEKLHANVFASDGQLRSLSEEILIAGFEALKNWVPCGSSDANPHIVSSQAFAPGGGWTLRGARYTICGNCLSLVFLGLVDEEGKVQAGAGLGNL